VPRAERKRRDDASTPAGHGLWSGTISFGLVSVPVSLFPANRPGGFHLRMLAPDGTPLRRRYVCPKEEKPVDGDEIVRGYPTQQDEWVIVTDEELDAIAPEKSRDIDLREFVPAGAIDPMHFERGYYLVPAEEGAHKAYRLLADVMEKEGRAGIATFVMRGREYLVAIFAEKGILRAETMRFADELRSAEDVGLPTRPSKADARTVTKIEKAIAKLAADDLDPDELEDRETEQVRKLAAEKRKRGTDVVEAEEVEGEEGEDAPGDLVRALAASLGGGRRGPSAVRRRIPARRAGTRRAKGKERASQRGD
jgi:DNA end-binding protein Ku